MGNEQLILKAISRMDINSEIPNKYCLDYPGDKTDLLQKELKEAGRKILPDFELDANNWPVYLQLVYWAIGDSKFMALDPTTKKPVKGDVLKGIYLAGNTGSGKSIATKILHGLYKKNPMTYYERKLEWKDVYASQLHGIYTTTGNIDDYKKVGVLCIQDLASEPVESIYMGNRIKVLADLLFFRAESPKYITIVTSNYPMASDTIRKMYGDRIYSRLFKMFNYLELTGPDRRRK